MLDLTLLANRTIRGAALAQLGGGVAMIGAIFALTLHFQDACGWNSRCAPAWPICPSSSPCCSPPRSPGGSLRALGHRFATLVAAATLTVSLAGMAWAVPHGYAAIAAAMVGMTIGLRTIMTICAIALVDAMPVNRTSVGAALNDTAREVGTGVGIAVVGTVLAAASAPPAWAFGTTRPLPPSCTGTPGLLSCSPSSDRPGRHMAYRPHRLPAPSRISRRPGPMPAGIGAGAIRTGRRRGRAVKAKATPGDNPAPRARGAAHFATSAIDT